MAEICPSTANKRYFDNVQVLPPSFFVVGAQKAGTTALHHYLVRHPDVLLPDIKETHFFDDGHGEFRLGVDHYLRKYFRAHAQHLISGEVDPEYLFFPEAASRISTYFPDSKLIFIFRDPVERAYSHYQMTFSRGRERLDFIKAIARETARMQFLPEMINSDAERVVYCPSGANEDEHHRLFNHVVRSDFSYVGRGFYYAQVTQYLKFFPLERMLFLLSDDMKYDAAETLKLVYRHIGVRGVPFVSLAHDQTNQATLPRSERLQRFLLDRSQMKTWFKRLIPSNMRLTMREYLISANARLSKLPPIDTEVESHLRLIYRDDVEQLATLIGRDLSSWLPKDARVNSEHGR